MCNSKTPRETGSFISVLKCSQLWRHLYCINNTKSKSSNVLCQCVYTCMIYIYICIYGFEYTSNACSKIYPFYFFGGFYSFWCCLSQGHVIFCLSMILLHLLTSRPENDGSEPKDKRKKKTLLRQSCTVVDNERHRL